MVPQPVYMNMSDLAAMAAQKKQQLEQSAMTVEESPDLKTPTAENQQMLPEQKVLVQLVVSAYCHIMYII